MDGTDAKLRNKGLTLWLNNDFIASGDDMVNQEWRMFFKRDLETAFTLESRYLQDSDQETVIDRMLKLPLDEAFLIIVESVPSLDNVTWLDFQRQLAARAQNDPQALTLLKMAHMMVNAENKVREILSLYGVVEAVAITKVLLQVRNKSEQFALLAFLHHLAKSDPQARAVWGHLLG